MRPSLSRMKYLLALPLLAGCHFPENMPKEVMQKEAAHVPQKELAEKRAEHAESLHVIITKQKEYLLNHHSLDAWTQCFTSISPFFNSLHDDPLADIPSEHVHYGGGGIYGYQPLYVGVVLDCSLGREITTELDVIENATMKKVTTPSLEEYFLHESPLCLKEKGNYNPHRHLLLLELKAEGNKGIYQAKFIFKQGAANKFKNFKEKPLSLALYLCLNK